MSLGTTKPRAEPVPELQARMRGCLVMGSIMRSKTTRAPVAACLIEIPRALREEFGKVTNKSEHDE